MIKKIKTIQRIKKLKSSRLDENFLYSFREDLQKFMEANPVTEKKTERLSMHEGFSLIMNDLHNKLINTKLMPIAIVIALITMLSGGGAALASQNSLPGDALYPVKTLTEDMRSALTINKQSEAKLQSKFAAERLEEVSKMLQENNVDSQGIEIALSKLKDHVVKMSQIVEEERTKGNDVAQLENELSDNLKTNKEVLERTFKQHKEEIENEKKGLEKEIDDAEKNKSDEQEINELKTKLDSLKQKKESFENKERSIKREIEDDEDGDDEDEERKEHEEKAYNAIEYKLAALKAVREAEKEKNELLAKASSSQVVIADKYFKQYDDFMAKASSSLALGGSISTSTATSSDLSAANYKQAYQFAKQAKESLERAEKEFEKQSESSKKKEERNREMKKQEEERNREAQKQEAEKNQEDGEDAEDKDEDRR